MGKPLNWGCRNPRNSALPSPRRISGKRLNWKETSTISLSRFKLRHFKDYKQFPGACEAHCQGRAKHSWAGHRGTHLYSLYSGGSVGREDQAGETSPWQSARPQLEKQRKATTTKKITSVFSLETSRQRPKIFLRPHEISKQQNQECLTTCYQARGHYLYPNKPPIFAPIKI